MPKIAKELTHMTQPLPFFEKSLIPPEQYPIDLWSTVGPPKLPLGLLPRIVEEFAVVMGYHMGASSAGLAMSALAVMGAAIPDRIQLQVKEHDKTWLESARIWVMQEYFQA